MLAWADSKVFGHEIQKSEIVELHIFDIHTDPAPVSKWRIIMSVVVQGKRNEIDTS
jgi:hypothetical protein